MVSIKFIVHYSNLTIEYERNNNKFMHHDSNKMNEMRKEKNGCT